MWKRPPSLWKEKTNSLNSYLFGSAQGWIARQVQQWCKVSERALMKTSILAMNPAKSLQTAISTTELTCTTIFARSLHSCFVENAPRFARHSFGFSKTGDLGNYVEYNYFPSENGHAGE